MVAVSGVVVVVLRSIAGRQGALSLEVLQMKAEMSRMLQMSRRVLGGCPGKRSFYVIAAVEIQTKQVGAQKKKQLRSEGRCGFQVSKRPMPRSWEMRPLTDRLNLSYVYTVFTASALLAIIVSKGHDACQCRITQRTRVLDA
jgi:hypothetical protein